MSHQETDKDAAVTAVFLLRRVLQVDKANGPLDNLAELARGQVRLGIVGSAERVVVKGDAVENGHEQQRPVAAALGHGHIAVVVDGQENVCDLVEVGQRRSHMAHVGLLHEQKRHARAQQDDAGLGKSRERLVLKVLLPKGDVVVGQPVVLERLHVFDGEQHIVVAEEGLFGRERIAEMAGHALTERHPGAVLALLPLLVRIVVRRRLAIGLGLGRAGAGAVAASVDKRQARKMTAAPMEREKRDAVRNQEALLAKGQRRQDGDEDGEM